MIGKNKCGEVCVGALPCLTVCQLAELADHPSDQNQVGSLRAEVHTWAAVLHALSSTLCVVLPNPGILAEVLCVSYSHLYLLSYLGGRLDELWLLPSAN